MPAQQRAADKAYDADRIRELTENQSATPNIPAKSNRKWKTCFSKRLSGTIWIRLGGDFRAVIALPTLGPC